MKKIVSVLLAMFCSSIVCFGQTSIDLSKPIQIVSSEIENINDTTANWLPGTIRDKLKSNLQDYMKMKTVVDAKSEKALKQVQKQTADSSHDENDAIEYGKITNAKFALFTVIRKTGSGYILSADFTDLTTGEQLASVTSKEYSKAEYLYGTTGAVDEVTLGLATKLDIPLTDLQKKTLSNGTADFTVEEQLKIAQENEKAYKNQLNNFDAEIAKLSQSTDLNAVENRKKLEAEKALLLEKQNSERKRQQELAEQKARADADAKLEAERSIELKTQRDRMATEAAAKAAEVRKLKMEKQGVLGQINVIESKKKALIEIRQGVENRCIELHEQLEKDRVSDEIKIKNRPLGTSEKDENGKQTEQSKQRRIN